MPYETPTQNTATSVATVAVRDTSVVGGEYIPQISLTTGIFGAGEATVEETEAMVQKIVSAINDHPDLAVVEAGRVFRMDQIITP